ncbi:MAG: SMP-30/gluconolactonase/LRE family protein [Lachnospiraceae bacterium]|nr:SMP-30/gluconolactonase/LRE family protein [Lachnospiraceae bacterium]
MTWENIASLLCEKSRVNLKLEKGFDFRKEPNMDEWRLICKKRCIIGESPIWNYKENIMYFTNGFGNEICMLDIYTGELKVRPVDGGVAAIAFDRDNRLIVSRYDGVYYLKSDNTMEPLYDTAKYHISYANDMKVGPDGRIYVGTQSGKRCGVSDKVDGKLYSIDASGRVRVLLDGLILSNGLDWSMDEKRFYHTDSDTHIIKEYDFDKESGDIDFTGRQVRVDGVDGFTIDREERILAACWGKGHIAVIDTKSMEIISHIETPAEIPASCGFVGKDMNSLAVVTASYHADIEKDPYAGFTLIYKAGMFGRKPYLFENWR